MDETRTDDWRRSRAEHRRGFTFQSGLVSWIEVRHKVEADAFFPAFDRSEWREVAAQRVEADADNEFSFTIRDLVRK